MRFKELTYKPMVQLLDYLRANDFRVFICSGGGMDYVRVVSEELYGVPGENVIGSNLFNSLFVLPVSALIRPLNIPYGGVVDILLTLAFSAALLLVFLFDNATMNRRTAFGMLSIYLAYMVMRVIA